MRLRATIALLPLTLLACEDTSGILAPRDGGVFDGGSLDAFDAGALLDAPEVAVRADVEMDARDDQTQTDAPEIRDSADGRDASPGMVDVPTLTEPMYSAGPVLIARLMGGPDFMLATARDGALWAWGDNSLSGMMQPADERSDWSYGDPRSRPQRIFGLTNVRERVRGGSGIGDCVIAGPEAAGSIYCWGRISYRALGDDYGDPWDLWRYPRRIGSVSDVIRTSDISSVIRSDLRSWGFRGHAGEDWHRYPLPPGSRQEFGGAGGVSWVNDGVIALETSEAYYEQGLQRLEGIVDIVGELRHSCVLTRDGRVRCWGENDYGAAGNFNEGDRCGTPTRPAGGNCRRALTEVAGVSDVVKIAGDLATTCAVRRDGTLWCWGYNEPLRDGLGSIGDGRSPSETCGRDPRGDIVPCSRRPVQVVGLRDVIDVGFYKSVTCALVASGAVYCWGRNDRGLVADGTREDRSTPTPVRWN